MRTGEFGMLRVLIFTSSLSSVSTFVRQLPLNQVTPGSDPKSGFPSISCLVQSNRTVHSHSNKKDYSSCLACPDRTAKLHLSVKLLASKQGPQPFPFLDFLVLKLQAQLESGGPITPKHFCFRRDLQSSTAAVVSGLWAQHFHTTYTRK